MLLVGFNFDLEGISLKLKINLKFILGYFLVFVLGRFINVNFNRNKYLGYIRNWIKIISYLI